MNIKILKNKKYYIPTQKIKEAKRNAKEHEELRRKISQMTDKEYKEYIKKEIEEAEKEIESGRVYSLGEVIKKLEEDSYLLMKEQKNYQNTKRLLRAKRGEQVLRNIIS